ncbi:hypothetical protein Ssi03_04160 [Sphaerisporangium siamense]|uniref:Uncharacterized protein n=1 Tax=Sphaerisporangium siamense TaxID=795645 RepID=A0A7W7DDE6_9ACTN|nr:hypothetical protein [Sphaerisporangium siamense]MBB4703955.1 hypothetical protein [Sphaerisporangium siamense]GII82426.1 hypothetical protein Ssi03_04160 [Sphaerisporangium siamense]
MLAADISAATQSGDRLAPVTLAHACRGFVLAGFVSGLLDQYAIPRRDAFAVGDDYCERAVTLLTEVLGEQLRRRYAQGTRGADLAALARSGEAELLGASPDDVDIIAAAMITLAAVLQDALAPLPDNESLPPTIRGAARMAADTARVLHAHYGGIRPHHRHPRSRRPRTHQPAPKRSDQTHHQTRLDRPRRAALNGAMPPATHVPSEPGTLGPGSARKQPLHSSLA